MNLETPAPSENMIEMERSQARTQVKDIVRGQISQKSYELDNMNDMTRAVPGRSVEKITSLMKEVEDLKNMWNILDRKGDIGDEDKYLIQNYFDSVLEQRAAHLRKQIEHSEASGNERVKDVVGIESEANEILEQISRLVCEEDVKASDSRFKDLQERLTQAVRKKESRQKDLNPNETAIENSRTSLAEAQAWAGIASKL